MRILTPGRILTSIMLLATVPALTGCGSSTPNAAASPTRFSTFLKYSQCMRSHGVPNFPDPSSSGGLQLRVGPGTGLDPSSPAFKTAQQACMKLLPNGGRRQPLSASQRASGLKFSQCMRSHGVPSFPDPSFGGGGARLALGSASGIDPNSPAFQAAQKACGGAFGKAP